VLGSDRRSEFNRHQNWWLQIGDLLQIGDQLSLTLSLTLPNLNLTIFPSIHCLVSGRRSEPIIIHLRPLSIVCIFVGRLEYSWVVWSRQNLADFLSDRQKARTEVSLTLPHRALSVQLLPPACRHMQLTSLALNCVWTTVAIDQLHVWWRLLLMTASLSNLAANRPAVLPGEWNRCYMESWNFEDLYWFLCAPVSYKSVEKLWSNYCDIWY